MKTRKLRGAKTNYNVGLAKNSLKVLKSTSKFEVYLGLCLNTVRSVQHYELDKITDRFLCFKLHHFNGIFCIEELVILRRLWVLYLASVAKLTLSHEVDELHLDFFTAVIQNDCGPL